MKRAVRIVLINVWMLMTIVSFAQTEVDQERMNRDIEIAENVLSTILKQEVNKRNFFPYDIEGTYTPGFGVTFRVPSDVNVGFMLSADNITFVNGSAQGSYSISTTNGNGNVAVVKSDDCAGCEKERAAATRARNKAINNSDSLRALYRERIIEASKVFIADYGDLISQLRPDEKIMVTNRGDHQKYWYGQSGKRTLITVEGTKADISQMKQGKISRDQLIAKLKIVNTETIDELNPDLELLSSIFNRLYRSDLSKTYYSENNIYYERLKDFGVIYYMQVYSSNQDDYKKYSMPTQRLENVDPETRAKKVTELYPAFEKEIKDNIVEYGRTVKSLKPEENLIFNVRMTKCEKCGIPSTLELTVKGSVLIDYNSGKLNKEAAIAKINVKKGPNQ